MFRVSPSQAARFLADKLHYQMFDFIDARRHYVFVSCLVEAPYTRRTSGQQPVLDVHLAAQHRRWCPRIAQFVLFVIKIPNAARAGAAPEGIRSRQAGGGGGCGGEAQSETGGGGADVATETTQRRGIRRILCPGVRRLFITDRDDVSNTDIFVRDYGEPAERSIWCARAAVQPDETSMICCVDVVAAYERS